MLSVPSLPSCDAILTFHTWHNTTIEVPLMLQLERAKPQSSLNEICDLCRDAILTFHTWHNTTIEVPLMLQLEGAKPQSSLNEICGLCRE
jgi:hypothetical protein